MTRTISIPEGLELPEQLGAVEDATVQMPVEGKIRAFIHRTGLLRAPESPSPLTDDEIRALSGDLDAEPSRSFLVDGDAALSRLEDSAYTQDEETGEWGYFSSSAFSRPSRMRSELVFPELMPLLEVAEHKIPRFLGCLLGAQYYALGLTVEAEPQRDPGFLHYWTLVGTDAETGKTRIDLLDRDTYEAYMDEPYPVPEMSSEPEEILITLK